MKNGRDIKIVPFSPKQVFEDQLRMVKEKEKRENEQKEKNEKEKKSEEKR